MVDIAAAADGGGAGAGEAVAHAASGAAVEDDVGGIPAGGEGAATALARADREGWVPAAADGGTFGTDAPSSMKNYGASVLGLQKNENEIHVYSTV